MAEASVGAGTLHDLWCSGDPAQSQVLRAASCHGRLPPAQAKEKGRMIRSKPLARRTPLRKVERRDCRVCGKRVERRERDAGWAHVRKPLVAHQPVPYTTKRTPKRKSLATRCDTLWAQLVKSGGVCAVDADGAKINLKVVFKVRDNGEWVQDKRYGSKFPVCAGGLDAAHVVPRRHRSVRWDPANGRPLCRAHHTFFGSHESAWKLFIGPEWDRLWVKAQERWNGDYSAVLAALAQAKEERVK